MLDLPTLIIANAMMCVTMSLLMVVSRLTLGAASAGALTWVAGDLLLEVARMAALADQYESPAGWGDVQAWHRMTSVAAIALVTAGIWWHLRALNRVDGKLLAPGRVAGESFLFAGLCAGVALSMTDTDARAKLLGAMIVVGTIFTLPAAWRLSKRFWGARVILLVLIMILAGKIVSITTHWSAADMTSSDQLSKMFLAETIISMALTMGFLVMLQEQVRQRLVELSVSDPLTGLYNRRGLLSLLQRDLERAQRTQNPLSMVLFDLDHFKKVNDNAGHDAGDAVLRGFAACLRATFRRTDVIGRWGGEEFVIVMSGVDVREAAIVAERLRVALHGRPLAEGATPITVSGGVAGADLSLEVDQAMNGLIASADRRMYDAKVLRDNVCASELSLHPA